MTKFKLPELRAFILDSGTFLTETIALRRTGGRHVGIGMVAGGSALTNWNPPTLVLLSSQARQELRQWIATAHGIRATNR